MRSDWKSRGRGVWRFFAGVVLVSFGLVFLLTNLGIIQSRIVHVWWPVIPIAIGFAKLSGWWLRPRKPYTDFA